MKYSLCAGKFPLESMGPERRVLHAQTRERGPPSALAEICHLYLCFIDGVHIMMAKVLDTLALPAGWVPLCLVTINVNLLTEHSDSLGPGHGFGQGLTKLY